MTYSITRSARAGGRIRAVALLGAMLLAGGARAGGGDDPQEILREVRKTYDGIRDAEIRFTERTRFPQSTLEQQSAGTLFLKKEHKYRIETEDQTVVTDGETVWSYSRANRQVLIDRFKAADNAFAPERILAGGGGDYAATFIGREKIGSADCALLKLVPRAESSLVQALHLWVDRGDWLVRKAVVTDVNGKETTYTVAEFRLNPGLSDSRFVLEIPQGAEVVDMR
ncbi:MAG TPA: outer membrane lipoprotein carrier protein LolA [Bacteroidota bacterium]|nr:outer membrane lipoprotein carrier protein LolA [Bacteroidota bacterium]